MPDTREIPSLMAQAAEAANANDTAAAVALLREVLDQQTATLGAEHKELAPTLNNLAMMLERQGDVAEAERCYRHAYDIARRGAAANDPLVQVSRANLNAFLQASGRIDTADSGPWGELDDFAADGEHLSSARDHRDVPAAHAAERIEYFADAPLAMELAVTPAPAPPPPVAVPRDSARRESASRESAARESAPRRPVSGPARAQLPPRESAPASDTSGGRSMMWLAVAVLGAALVGVWMTRTGAPESPRDSTARPPAASNPPGETPSAPAAPAPSSTSTPERSVPAPAAAPPAANTAATAPTRTPAPAPTSATPVSPAGAVSADVSLCSGLNRSGAAWRCEPAGETVRAGALYYYTRVKSPRDVVVTHRWTRDGRTVQSVNLRVGANPTAGFRTFSRQTVSATQGGTWEVTLLGPGGTVLDRRTFTVRGS